MKNKEFKKLSLKDKKEGLKTNAKSDEWSIPNPNKPIDECDDIETKGYITYVYPKTKRLPAKQPVKDKLE